MSIRVNKDQLKESIEKAFNSSVVALKKTDKRFLNKGRPPKEIRFIQKNIRLENSDWKAMEEYCARKGLSTSAGIRLAVKEWLEKVDVLPFIQER